MSRTSCTVVSLRHMTMLVCCRHFKVSDNHLKKHVPCHPCWVAARSFLSSDGAVSNAQPSQNYRYTHANAYMYTSHGIQSV